MTSSLLRQIGRAYRRQPVASIVGLYGTLYFLGDLSQQTICRRPEKSIKSATQVAAVGAGIFGPFYYYWYRFLDSRLPGTALKTIARKVVFDQMVAGAGCVFIFYVATSALERQEHIFKDAIEKGPKTFMTGCVYWPTVQCVNFALVPPPYRTVYVAFAAFVWTNIICYIKSKKTTTKFTELPALGTTTSKGWST